MHSVESVEVDNSFVKESFLPPRFVLASASPRRRALLTEAGFDFEVRPVDVVEVGPEDHEDPWWAVRENARRKAVAAMGLAVESAREAILTADTILVLRGCWIGKPRDRGEAMQILTDLAGQVHQVATAVALVGPVEAGFSGSEVSGIDPWVEVTEVVLKPLAAAEIRAYHAAVDPLDKAGGYDINEHGPLPGGVVASIRGSYSNVMGLPMERLVPRLESWLR